MRYIEFNGYIIIDSCVKNQYNRTCYTFSLKRKNGKTLYSGLTQHLCYIINFYYRFKLHYHLQKRQ